jgi:hypothetical protein
VSLSSGHADSTGSTVEAVNEFGHLLRIREVAARACRRQCHRLTECQQLPEALGHDVGGIIAGRVLPSRWRQGAETGHR